MLDMGSRGSVGPVVGVLSLVFCGVSWAQVVDPWAAPSTYYANVAGTGVSLKATLTTAMSAGHVQRSYGDFRTSAALHDRNPANPSQVLLVYDRRSVPSVWDSGATWNREHVWPDSRQPGDANNSSRGMQGDPHCLRPATPSVNGARGNFPFTGATRTGAFGSDGASRWFPGDADKGDCARVLFYADTRWGPSLNVSLVNGTAISGFQMGDLASCIAWHYLDTPDEFERRRNHVIFSSAENPSFFTANRNAYVDRPEYVWSVYVDQMNDSRLSIADAMGQGDVAADGSSTTVVDLGRVFVGGAVPPAASVMVLKDGFDGTYYSVTATGGATSSVGGRHNAFSTSLSGLDSRVLTVGFDAETTMTAQVAVGAVTIDNLDVTTQGGTGRGANDADDVVIVELDVLARSNASFEAAADVNSATVDFGTVTQGSGEASRVVMLHNLQAVPGATAEADVELGSAVGDASAFAVTGLPARVPAGGSLAVEVRLPDAAVGDFEAVYTIRAFDDRRVNGFAEGTPLTLTVRGVVTAGGPCAADFNGDTVAGDIFDLFDFLAALDEGLDFNGDTSPADIFDLFDFLAVLDTGCP